MAEQLHANGPEQENRTPEQIQEASERNAELANERKRNAEKFNESHDVESVRNEALEKAKSIEKEPRNESNASVEKQIDRPQKNTKATRKTAFKKQMKDVQSEMSAPSRTFSKVIHNPAVEKTSEAVGSTIARPNAIVSGAVAAFVLTGALYLWAKYAGYPLSGFESIGAFIVGWLLGVIFDYTRIMVTGKR